MAQLQCRTINPATAPRPIGAYSQAMRVKAGELLFIAGQVAVDARGNLVGQGDAASQTRQAFENIGLVLAGVGASFGNVVEFTTYLVGRESIRPFINARAELFLRLYPNGDYLPNTLLIVNGLVSEDFLVEIKAIAALP